MEPFSYPAYLAFAERILYSAMHDGFVLDTETNQPRKALPGEGINTTKARTLMRKWVQEHGYCAVAGEENTVNDLASEARADLVIWAVTSCGAGRAHWESAQNTNTLELYPADELYLSDTFAPKRDWQTRWNTARQRLGPATISSVATSPDGPFIALKNDPIWCAISRWGVPFSPFDFYDGMLVRDADDDKTEALGILDCGTLKPSRKKWSVPLIKIAPERIDDLR